MIKKKAASRTRLLYVGGREIFPSTEAIRSSWTLYNAKKGAYRDDELPF